MCCRTSMASGIQMHSCSLRHEHCTPTGTSSFPPTQVGHKSRGLAACGGVARSAECRRRSRARRHRVAAAAAGCRLEACRRRGRPAGGGTWKYSLEYPLFFNTASGLESQDGRDAAAADLVKTRLLNLNGRTCQRYLSTQGTTCMQKAMMYTEA